MSTGLVSVVLPVHDEREGVGELIDAVANALEGRPFEIVCTDDASTDGSGAVLEELARSRKWLHVLHFPVNFGQTAALSAGIDASSGDVVVLMDSDGQNDPADIPALLETMELGYDVVSGWRQGRVEGLGRRLPSWVANRLLSSLSGVPVRDGGCSLKAYRGELLRALVLLRDDHRFLASLAAGLGARYTEIPVRHHPRRAGRSHYGAGRIPRVAVDLIGLWLFLRFRGRPLRAFAVLGVVAAGWWLLLALGLALWSSPAAAVLATGAAATCALAGIGAGAALEIARRTTGLYRLQPGAHHDLVSLR